MPWHPPCALSNLIVTNLSSCQRIDFSIFDSFFLLRPTAKLFAFYCARALFLTHSQLVSLQDVFHLAVQFSKYIQVSSSFRFPIPENDTGSRRLTVIRPLRFSLRGFLRLFGFLRFRAPTQFPVYRPGMNFRVSPSVLSLERR